MEKEFFPIVTTSRNEREIDKKRAMVFIEEFGGEFQRRNEQSLESLVSSDRDVVIFEHGYPGLYKNGSTQSLRFHLNMAALRLDRLKKGGKDRFLEVSGILPGMNILDGTLGLGSDALVAAWRVGDAGKVIALEASPGIFGMMKFSFSLLEKEGDPEIQELIRRISLKNIDFERFTSQCDSESFDIVYLDPMFDKPRSKSDGIDPLRLWAEMKGLDYKAVLDGLRVSKKRLVIKEPKASRWWIEEEIPLANVLTGQRYQSVRYRLLEKENL